VIFKLGRQWFSWCFVPAESRRYTQRHNNLRIVFLIIYRKRPTDKDIHAVRCVCLGRDLCRSV